MTSWKYPLRTAYELQLNFYIWIKMQFQHKYRVKFDTKCSYIKEVIIDKMYILSRWVTFQSTVFRDQYHLNPPALAIVIYGRNQGIYWILKALIQTSSLLNVGDSWFLIPTITDSMFFKLFLGEIMANIRRQLNFQFLTHLYQMTSQTCH